MAVYTTYREATYLLEVNKMTTSVVESDESIFG